MSLIRGTCAACLLALCFTGSSLAQSSDVEDALHNLNDVIAEFDDDPVEIDDDYLPTTDLDALRAAHRDYAARKDLQLERPVQAPQELQPPKPPPRWLVSFREFLNNLGPVFQVIFWVCIAAVVLGILYFLFGEAIRVRLGQSGKGKVDEGDDVLTDLRPDAASARSLLEAADALAREGKYAEAVHLLLFRSIEDIQQRLEGGVPRSLTAREIGSLGRLPDRARNALGPIIRIVESSFFGGRDVDAAGWKTARASYETFAFGESW